MKIKRNLRYIVAYGILLHTCWTSGFVQGLQVGDKMPILKLENVYNTTAKTLDLNSIKGKLVILDFWATNCGGCIQAFPKLDSIQKVFNDKVQIILVNQESFEATSRFFAKRKLVKPRVPFITADSVLNNLFPHDGVPFHVWIDEDGVVKYLTNGTSTAMETVRAYLNDDPLRIAGYQTGRPKIAPIWNQDYEPKMEYFSVLAKCIAGNMDSYSKELSKRSVSVAVKCESVVEMYQRAFYGITNFDFTRVGRTVITLEDSFKFTRPTDMLQLADWREKYAYAYRLLVPKERKGEMYDIMRSDLDRFFGLNAHIEKKRVKCFVLSRTSAVNRVATQGGTTRNTFKKSDEDGIVNDSVRALVNARYEYFSSTLGYWLEKEYSIPFVDATGLSGKIDLAIPGKVIEELKIDNLNRALKWYDLEIEEKPYDIDVLIIEDK